MEMKTTKAEAGDFEKNKMMAILAYFIFFLPLLVAKDSKYAMFHANQSLILVLVAIASSIIGGVIPVIGPLISMVVSLGVFVLWIMGIIAAANGEMKELPVIGAFKILK